MPPGIPGDGLQRQRQALSLFRRTAAGDPPTDLVIGEALDLALSFLRADRCVHASRRSGADSFVLSAGRGWEEGVIGGAELSGDRASLGEYATGLEHPLVVEDLRLVPQFRSEPVLVAAGLKGALLTPINGQRGASGLLGVFSSRRRLFSPDDAEFLRGLADVIAAALYREDWRLRLASRHPMQRPGSPGNRPG